MAWAKKSTNARLRGGLQNRGYGFAIINDEQPLRKCRTAGTAVAKMSNSGFQKI